MPFANPRLIRVSALCCNFNATCKNHNIGLMSSRLLTTFDQLPYNLFIAKSQKHVFEFEG